MEAPAGGRDSRSPVIRDFAAFENRLAVIADEDTAIAVIGGNAIAEMRIGVTSHANARPGIGDDPAFVKLSAGLSVAETPFARFSSI